MVSAGTPLSVSAFTECSKPDRKIIPAQAQNLFIERNPFKSSAKVVQHHGFCNPHL
jgi:hypothetical protein